MAKIHKSPNVFMESERPVTVSKPDFGELLKEETGLNSDEEKNQDTAGKSFKDIFQSVRGKDDRSGTLSEDIKSENTANKYLQNKGTSYATVNKDRDMANKSKENMSVQQIIRRAEDEADRIKAEARQQAALTLQQNKLKVMAERQAGYQDGFREGQIAAQVMYEQQLTQIQKSFHEIAKELSKKPDDLLSGMEEQILDLSLEVAGKIIGVELSKKNKSYHAFLRKALDRLKKQEKATVYLNDREYQLFVASQPDLFTDESGTIQFVGDEKLPSGSCIIETARGRFDASAQLQLERIGKAMKG